MKTRYKACKNINYKCSEKKQIFHMVFIDSGKNACFRDSNLRMLFIFMNF